jgi:hypothetical protein
MSDTMEASPFPPPPNDGNRIWMRVAWLASGARDRSSRATGIVALRPCPDDYDRVVAVAGSDSSQSAIRSLITQAAKHGICLRGAACFLFPGLGPQEDFQLLLGCGISKVLIPDVPVPKRLKDDEHTCRWAASSLGVEIVQIDLDVVFSPLLHPHA